MHKEQFDEVKEYAKSLGFVYQSSSNKVIISFIPEKPPININTKVAVLYSEVNYDDNEGYHRIAFVDVNMRQSEVKEQSEIAEFMKLVRICYMIVDKITRYNKE